MPSKERYLVNIRCVRAPDAACRPGEGSATAPDARGALGYTVSMVGREGAGKKEVGGVKVDDQLCVVYHTYVAFPMVVRDLYPSKVDISHIHGYADIYQ